MATVGFKGLTVCGPIEQAVTEFFSSDLIDYSTLEYTISPLNESYV